MKKVSLTTPFVSRFMLICWACLCPAAWLNSLAEAAQSPKAAAESSVAIIVPPVKVFTSVTLSWNDSNIVPVRFEVQEHTNANYAITCTFDSRVPLVYSCLWYIPEGGWSTLAYTTNKSLVIPIKPVRNHLFRMRAQDTSTGLVSDWARQ